MSRLGNAVAALAGAALVLVIATWFNNTLLRDAMRDAQANFDASGVSVITAVGALLVAGSVLILGGLAWWSASLVVGVTYTVVGGFLVMLPWIVWNFAAQINDAPPILPEPLLTIVSEIYWRTEGGWLNAVGTIGAAMLITGVVVLVRWQRDRAAAKGSDQAMPRAAGPSRS